jgi:hypothetical protein
MPRIVALSNPSCRKSASAASRILRPVSSALGVDFVVGVDLNVFNINVRLSSRDVKRFLNAFRFGWRASRLSIFVPRVAELGQEALQELERRYSVKQESLEPRVSCV